MAPLPGLSPDWEHPTHRRVAGRQEHSQDKGSQEGTADDSHDGEGALGEWVGVGVGLEQSKPSLLASVYPLGKQGLRDSTVGLETSRASVSLKGRGLPLPAFLPLVGGKDADPLSGQISKPG